MRQKEYQISFSIQSVPIYHLYIVPGAAPAPQHIDLNKNDEEQLLMSYGKRRRNKLTLES